MTKKELQTKEFKVYMPFSVKEDSEESVLKIKGWANFCGNMGDDGAGAFVDHANEVIVPSGFDLSVWKKNPQILWQHDSHYPCGKGLKASKKQEGLEIDAEVHQKAMKEEDWYRVKTGIVSYFSVGFRCKAGEWKEVNGKHVYFITKALLYEVSLVTIPCNSESGFSIIKSLNEDGFYGGELDQYKEQPNNTEGDDVMKLKRKDLLSAEDAQKLKELGLEAQLEDLVDVDLKKYISDIVKAELEVIKEAELKVKEEADLKAAEEVELKAKEEAELKVKEEAELKAKIDAEVEEYLKSLLSKLELTQKDLA